MSFIPYATVSATLGVISRQIAEADQRLQHLVTATGFHDDFIVPMHTATRQQLACLKELTIAVESYRRAIETWHPGAFRVSSFIETASGGAISLGAGILSYIALAASQNETKVESLEDAMAGLDALISKGLRDAITKADGFGSRELEPPQLGRAYQAGHPDAIVSIHRAAGLYEQARQGLLGLRLPAEPKPSAKAFAEAAARLGGIFGRSASALYFALK